jgi:hypothetical protein
MLYTHILYLESLNTAVHKHGGILRVESYDRDQRWETSWSADRLLASDVGLSCMKLSKRRMLLMIACKPSVFSVEVSKQGYQNAGQG